MLKKFLFSSIILYFILSSVYAVEWFSGPESDKSYTNKKGDVIDKVEGDAIRKGASSVGTNIKGTVNEKISDSNQAKSSTLDAINSILNYLLSLLGFIALLYLLYHGFLMVTAAGNDEAYKKGGAGVKYALMVLLGIGASWFFISIIFYIVDISTSL